MNTIEGEFDLTAAPEPPFEVNDGVTPGRKRFTARTTSRGSCTR